MNTYTQTVATTTTLEVTTARLFMNAIAFPHCLIVGAIAIIIVLYILKIGLNVFCKYTASEGEEEKK